MRKERSGLMQVLAVAGAYTAYHIGSGFATGNEIAQFFVSWGGVWPFIVFAVAALFAAGTNYIMYTTGCLVHFNKSNKCYYYYCGKYIGKIFDYYVYITLVAFIMVMITGSGATIRQYFDLPEYVGTIGMGVVCALVACLGLRKLVDVLGCIGIIIMVFTVSCGIYMILTADVSPLEGAKNTAQYVAEGKILQPTVLGIKNPILAGLSYGGVLMLALPWVTSMGSLLKSKKQAAATSVLSALFLFAAAFSVALALMLNLDDVAGSQIPMLAAVQAHLPLLAGFYSIVIILGIFTTATGQLFILADRFSQQGTKKFYAIVFGTVAFGIATGSFIPFTTIVNIVYSVLGLSGVILSVFLLVKIIRVRRSGAAEAG